MRADQSPACANDSGLFDIENPAILHKDGNSQHKGESSQHNAESSQHKNGMIDQRQWQILESLAEAMRNKKRVSAQDRDNIITGLCKNSPLTAKQISILIGRKLSTVSIHYLPRLLKEGRIRLKYSDRPNHPDQAYVALRPDGNGHPETSM